MDANILNNIISSDITIKLNSADEPESEKVNEDFPVTKKILIDGLSKTFTRLLSYKVSREAYQRYSVRLEVIVSLTN